MLLNKTYKKASGDTNEQNSEYQRLLKSDLDDTASVEHECHYQKHLLGFFFFPVLLMFFKGMIVKFPKSLPVIKGR